MYSIWFRWIGISFSFLFWSSIQLMDPAQQDISQMNIRAYVMNNTDVMESTDDDIILCNSTPDNMILYSVDARDTYLNNAIVFESNPGTIVTDKAKKFIAPKYQPSEYSQLKSMKFRSQQYLMSLFSTIWVSRAPRLLPRIAPKPSTTPVTNDATNIATLESNLERISKFSRL